MSAAAHEVPPAIRWDEGLLLTPQHFQWTARRAESLLHFHTATLSPFHWGVTRLAIDGELLVNGTFRITALEAVLPDGLIVHWPNGDDASAGLQMDLQPHKARLADGPVRIHLGVIAHGHGPARDRYDAADLNDVPDEHSNACAADITVLRPRLQLLFGETSGRHVSIPMAEVQLAKDGFALTRYEPPALRVSRESGLYELCAAVAGELRRKANHLADRGARGVQFLESRARVHGMVAGLPMLEAALHTELSHPYPLYLALCALYGHAAALGEAQVPPPLAPYDHHDLRATFEQVAGRIKRALAEGMDEAYHGHPFAFLDKENEFRLKFDPAWRERRLLLAVRGRAGGSAGDMAAWVNASVVGGDSVIALLRDRRVMGLRREPFDPEDPDADAVPSRGTSLYTLVPDGRAFPPGDDLVIVNHDLTARRPQEIVLYVQRA